MKTYVLVLRDYDYYQFDSVEFATTDWDKLMHKVAEYNLACFVENSEEYSEDLRNSFCGKEVTHLVIMEFGA